MSELTAASLFAGIGGIDLALELAGVRVVAAVEIDPAARGVHADRFSNTTLFNDVCEVAGDDLRAVGFDPDNGIIAAGWPCQDLSVAGRRLGLGGARSGLFWEVVRLLADLRPRWFLLENVPGLLSAVCPCLGDNACGDGCGTAHPVRGGACGPGRCMELHGGAMGAVLGALADLGYGVAYRVLDAQHFGVPQRRRRVVFVGCLGDGAAPVQVLLEPEGRGGDSAARRATRPGSAAVAALSASDGGADDNDAAGGRLIAAPVRSANHYGDHAAAESHLTVMNALTAHHGRNDPNEGGLVPVAFDTVQITSAENRVHPQPGDPSMPLVATGRPHVAYAVRAEPGGVGQAHNTTYVPLGGEGMRDALTAEGHDASEDGTGRGTPLVPVAFDWQSDGSERVYGNVSTSRTSTLGTKKQDAIADATAVRRLTPTECERLQGFPDGWTATSNGRPQSDSARYRELGNSVAVPVFAWIAQRLAARHLAHLDSLETSRV